MAVEPQVLSGYVIAANMDSMLSDSTLEIPKEVYLLFWLLLMANLTVNLYGRLPSTEVAIV